MADASTTSTDVSQIAPILALLLQMAQSQSGGTSTTGQGSGATNATATNNPSFTSSTSSVASSIPKSDASDQSLMDWYESNHGKTVYGADGSARTIPVAQSSSAQGGQYGMASGMYGNFQGNSFEPGNIRAWIDQPNGILNGASTENPLFAKAQALLDSLSKGSSASDNSELTPATTSPATPAAAPALTAYDPNNTSLIKGLNSQAAPATSPIPPAALPVNLPVPPGAPVNTVPNAPAVPAAIPATAPAVAPVAPVAIPPSALQAAPALPTAPVTTVPANNPTAVTNMINAQASQALSNPNLTASSAQMSGAISDTGVPVSQSFLNSISPYLRKYDSPSSSTTPSSGGLFNSAPQMSMAQAAPYQTPGGGTINMGSVDAPYNQAAGANMSGLSSGAYAASGGAPSVGSVTGGGGMSAGQASALASGISGIGKGIGQMFTPGTVGIPQMPSGVPLSQFQAPRMQ